MTGFWVFFFLFLMSTLCFASLNARGLTKYQKMEKLMILTKQCDVLCLQETFWEDKISDEIRKLWDGEMYMNCDLERKRGVAILIKRGIFEENDIDYKDTNGRIIIVKLLYKDRKIKLCNIHAPNEDREKFEFYKSLNILMEKQENDFLVGE